MNTKSCHLNVCACGYTKEKERNKEEKRAISATQLEIVKNGLSACVCLCTARTHFECRMRAVALNQSFRFNTHKCMHAERS